MEACLHGDGRSQMIRRLFSEEFLSLSEAAKCLGVTSSTIRNWILKGKLKTVRRVGAKYLVYKPELESLVQIVSSDRTEEVNGQASSTVRTQKVMGAWRNFSQHLRSKTA